MFQKHFIVLILLCQCSFADSIYQGYVCGSGGSCGPNSPVLNATVTATSLTTGSSYSNWNSGAYFSVSLPGNDCWKILVTAPGYLSYSLSMICLLDGYQSEAAYIFLTKKPTDISNDKLINLYETIPKLAIPSRSNHLAVIGFSLLHSDLVSVKIYNSSGREIATLVNKNFGPGSHSANWDTKNIAAGCYTVRMQVGTNSYVRSVPILR
jgi:hypothetical protein